MKKKLQTLQNYETIADDLKFLPNSILRLRILKSLYNSPMNMKEVNQKTDINYSAISNILHVLELKGQVYKKNNRYYLSNTMYSHMDDILNIITLIDLLERISSISNNHIIDSIPTDSICSFHYLENINLIESDDMNIYKIYDVIEKAIKKAEFVNAILPFSYANFNYSFNRLLFKNRNVNLITPGDIKDIIIKNLDTSRWNLKIESPLYDKSNFLLLVLTDKKMMLGFFKQDNTFDQNRLLVSDNPKCIEWANDLFENFKKENILNEY